MIVKSPYFISLLLSTHCIGICQIASATEINTIYDRPDLKEGTSIKVRPEIARKIKNVTVKIISSSEGSGVISFRDKNGSYTITTAWHNLRSIGKEEEIEIITFDGKSHYAKGSDVKRVGEGDYAHIHFTSDSNYTTSGNDMILTNADAQKININDQILVAGYPKSENNLLISSGRLLSKSIEFDNQGYGLNYTNQTTSGMSGGGVFNLQGQQFGVHGQASLDERASEYAGTRQKSGISVGMPLFVAERRQWSVWEETPKHEVRNLIRFLLKELKTKPTKHILIKLGSLYAEISHYSLAEKYHTAALEFKRDMPTWEYLIVLNLRAIDRIAQKKVKKARNDLKNLIVLQESNGKSSVDSMMLLITTIPSDEDKLEELENWVSRNGEQNLSYNGFLLLSNLYDSQVNPSNSKNDNSIYSKKIVNYIRKALYLCDEDYGKKGSKLDERCSAIEIRYATRIAGIDLDRYQKALSIINKYINNDPTNPDLFVKRSLIHLAGNKFTNGLNPIIADLNTARSIDKYHIEANYWFNVYGYHASKELDNNFGRNNEYCQDMIRFQEIILKRNAQDRRVDYFVQEHCSK